MRISIRSQLAALLCTLGSISGSGLMAEDWPQWQGPQRDGVIRETGLVSAIPKEGLELLWRAPVSGGYSGPAVAGGRVFVSDYVRTEGDASNDPGGRRKLLGSERLVCLDEATGKELWVYESNCEYNISYPAGPRATPTVDGEVVYTLGAEGRLTALSVSDAKVLWQHELKQKYKAESPIWGYSAPPLVFGDLLITLAGGEGSIVVAFNKLTGEEVWKGLSAAETGYAPPTLIEHDGVKQLLIWTSDELYSLEPLSGKVYWQVPLKPQYGMSIMAPQYSEGKLFASGIGNTAAMLQMGKGTEVPKVLWKGKPKEAVYAGNATPLFYRGALYGPDCQTGTFVAVNSEDGTRFWESFAPTTGKPGRASHGTAFVARAGESYFLFSETGDLISAQLSHSGYKETGRFHLIEPTGECFGRNVVWSYPAYANSKVIVRNDKEVVAYSLKGK